MQYTGAIFDVDGVLVDTPHEHAWRESLQRLMTGEWLEIAPHTRYTAEGFTTAVYQEHLAGKPRPAGAQAALDYFNIVDPDGARLQQYMTQKQAMIEELIERGEFTVFPDALRFLLRLKGRGLKLAAASSSKNANKFLSKIDVGAFVTGGGMQGEALPFELPASLTMLDLFDANVCGHPFEHGKPAPDIFLGAAAAIPLPPAQCFVVEDASSGVQAAKAGGMYAIGVARLNDQALLQAAGADRVVTNLDEIDVDALVD
ncbi:MAG: HAD-IA family hydrolase [Roseiflexaceae bacterium]|nr:HAD-IA family hydrolase [Roseiflexaceae bacterium]